MQLEPSAFQADSDLVEALEKRSVPVACAKDQVLFRQGDAPTGIFLLRQGRATLTIDGVGGDQVLSVDTGSGSLLGLPGLLGNQPYSMTAIAREAALVHYISREEFTEFMQSTPQLALKILQVLAAEVRTARRALY